MKGLRDTFLHLEKVLGTEGAFNILMVEENIRKSFFEALVFSTLRRLDNYMKKYSKLLVGLKNIDLYIFEIKEDTQYNQHTIRFMVYNKKYEIDVKRIKTYTDHKLIGYMLDYSCPSDLGKPGKVSYALSLVKDVKCCYQHNWIDPGRVNVLKQQREQLFAYNCPTNRDKDYANVERIGKKCIALIKKMGLPYRIEIIKKEVL